MVNFWLDIPLLVVLIGLSGFFSGLEVALVGTRRSKTIQFVKEGRKGASALHKLKSNPGWMMASVNLGNNVVNVGASALATSIAIELFADNGLGIAVGIMTFVILVFGEITPKTYCNANADKIALRFAPVLLAFSYAVWPLVKLFEMITRGVVRLTGSSYLPPPITEDEIKHVIDQGMAENAIEREERELVHGALSFDDISIRSVMTPRTKMFALPASTILFDALPQINESGHSRIPIYGKDIDDIVGFVHVKDILKELEGDNRMKSLELISRKPVFASQEKTVRALLDEMKGRKVHLAMVIDEHSGIEGLVTFEDLIEEIVGEVEDEGDKGEAPKYTSIDRDTIIAGGEIEVERVCKILRADIPKDGEHLTLNGLLHEQLRDIPREGDKVEIGRLRIVVEKVAKNRSEQIRVEKIRG